VILYTESIFGLLGESVSDGKQFDGGTEFFQELSVKLFGVSTGVPKDR